MVQSGMKYVIPLIVLAAPAFADGLAQGKTVDCYCTDTAGGRVELGQTICMFVDGRAFMAQCQMSLNSPMWRRMQEGCQMSDAAPSALERLEALKPS